MAASRFMHLDNQEYLRKPEVQQAAQNSPLIAELVRRLESTVRGERLLSDAYTPQLSPLANSRDALNPEIIRCPHCEGVSVIGPEF